MKNNTPIILLAAMLILVISGCTPVRYVQSLEKGEWAGTFSLGGPLITNFGPPVPVPLTTLNAGYGISNTMTGFASIHPTAWSFGVLQ